MSQQESIINRCDVSTLRCQNSPNGDLECNKQLILFLTQIREAGRKNVENCTKRKQVLW